MRHTWMALLMMVAFALPLAAQQRADKFAVGDEAPDIAFTKSFYGSNQGKLSDFRGEYVHLIFWATW